MAKYVDGFVIPIKKKNVKDYKKMAQLGCKVWMEHGALEYYECVGANLNHPWGIPFEKFAKLKKDETVIFAYIVYKSKKHRDSVTKKVMADKRMDPKNWEGKKMPFDMKRYTVGEFDVLVSA